MKKTISLMLIVIMLISSFSYGFAMDEIGFMEVPNSDSLIENVISLIPLFYCESQFETKNLYIGKKMSSYLWKEKKIEESEYESYPLFSNNDIIGVIDVIRNTDNSIYQVSISHDIADCLSKEYTQDTTGNVALLYVEDWIYLAMETTNTLKCLKEGITRPNREISINNLIDVKYSPLEKDIPLEFFDLPAMSSSSSAEMNTITIQRVPNRRVSCCGGGLCWAASIAMMSNYFMGTSYNADNVHNICGCISSSNYHNEEKSYIRQLGMYAGGPNYTYNYTKLKTCIDSDRLALLDLQDSSAHNAHNVVAYGYYQSSTGRKSFYYMDPNYGERVSTFPTSTSATVYIPIEGLNYAVHCYIYAY